MIWIISELFYPEEAATAHYMTGIAEGLARECSVGAICAQPKYDAQPRSLPSRERHNGVEIERCWATTLDKNKLLLRLVNILTATLSIFWRCLRRFRRGDQVLVVTNPPLLPFLVLLACRIRRAKCYLRVDDVYPEATICAGLVGPKSALANVVNWCNRRLYRRMERVVVLGRDMASLVANKMGEPRETIMVIPNWADVEEVSPKLRSEVDLIKEYCLSDKFIVGYAGNIGRVQAIGAIFQAMLSLRDTPDIHFLFIGSGQKVGWLRAAAAEAGLKNFTLAGQRPRRDQADFLNACDISIVSLVSGMFGAGVPSRSYNIMAAGKPMLAVMDSDSEIGELVREEEIGWVVPPDDPARLAEAILEARRDLNRLAEMGRRARAAAETKYSSQSVISRYCQLLSGKRRAPVPAAILA